MHTVPEIIAALCERHRNLIRLKDNATWNEWLNIKHREFRDLTQLLEGGSNERFKARALLLLTLPNRFWSPVPINDDSTHRTYYGWEDTETIKLLPMVLIHFLKDIVLTCLPLVREIVAADGRADQLLSTYNNYLRQLLTRLPEDQAEEVFANYQLNDPAAWFDQEDASGYNPLRALWRDKDVPERWKRAADAKMRAIIAAELAGTAKPRQDHEEALQCYYYALQSGFWHYSPTVEYQPRTQLLTEQVRYLVSLIPSLPPDRHLFDSDDLYAIFGMLTDPNEQYRLAWFVVTGNGRGFTAFSDASKDAAQQIHNALMRMNDQELIAKLEGIIQDGTRRRQEYEGQMDSTQTAEEAVVSKMMRP